MGKGKQPNKTGRIVPFAALLLLLGALTLILFATLKDFNFRFRYVSLERIVAGFVLPSSSTLDFWRNIILFLPFGFSLGAFLDTRGLPRKRVAQIVVLCAFCLTLTVESLQNFLPGRQPSVADILTNTFGAVMGLAVFRLWQNRSEVIRSIGKLMAVPQKVLAVVGIYCLLLMFISQALVNHTRFEEWDPAYRMAVGNAPRANRPWLGSVRDLVIIDRALEQSEAQRIMSDPQQISAIEGEVLAYYPLYGGGDQADLTGNQPDLVWYFRRERVDDSMALQIDGKHWLGTEVPVRALSTSLEAASQVSLRLTTSTPDLLQTGPARIVTISKNRLQRNFTVGQQKDALIVRFRSHFSGNNGTQPEIRFYDFFTDTESRDFVITYDGLSVNLIDSQSQEWQAVEVVPGVAFINYLVPFLPEYWSVGQDALSTWVFRLFFYIPFFAPLGVLIALPAIGRWPRHYKAALIVSCLFLIPLLVELSMVAGPGMAPRTVHMGLSAAVIAFSVLVVTLPRRLLSTRLVLRSPIEMPVE